jgi:hypothetical protein
MTKTLDDVKADMSELYEQVKAGQTEIKLGDALANIAGKFLKAETLIVAHRALDQRLGPVATPIRELPNA